MLWPSLSYGIIFLLSNFQKANRWLAETARRVRPRSVKMSSKAASPTKEKFTPSARPLKCKYCWRRFKYRHAGSTVQSYIARPKLRYSGNGSTVVLCLKDVYLKAWTLSNCDRARLRDCLSDHMRRDHLKTIVNSIIERKKAQMSQSGGLLVIEQHEIEAELDERKPIRVSVIKRLPY